MARSDCLLAIFLLATVPLATNAGQGKLVCYSELWASGRPSPADYEVQEHLPTSTCDYLILIFLTLDSSNWSLKLNSGYGDVDPDVIHRSVQTRENNPDMKILISVGGWEDGVAKYSEMMSRASNRKDFIRSVLNTLETYDLDGLELHWIYPGANWRQGTAGDRDNFVELVQELNLAFKEKKYILTAAVPPDDNNLRDGYNVRILSSLLHQMHVRTIDMRGDWTGAASGHSPLYSSPGEKPELQKLNMNDSLALWVQRGASPRRLIPIVAFYGRSFNLRDPNKNDPGAPVSGPGKESPFIRAPGLMAYFEICDAVQNKLMTERFQSGAEMPYAFRDNLWVGFENGNSLQRKIKTIIQKEYGGLAVFGLGLDDFTGKCGHAHYLLNRAKYFLKDEADSPDPRGAR